MSKTAGLDLDSILDQALDDFEEIESAENAKRFFNKADKRNSRNNEHQASGKEALNDDRVKNTVKADRMMEDFNNPVYGETLQSTMRDLSGSTAGIKTVNDLLDRSAEESDRGMKTGFAPSRPGDTKEGNLNVDPADREVAETLKMIAEAQKGMEGFEAGKLEEVGETMMEDMMQQFEALGEKEDYDEVIDGVMRQLLSRDLMYQPTKQICEKFPEWLATNKANLTSQEYDNYGKMYQTFQHVLATYDTEPDNFSRLMELLFDMQQYGQPPAEIIKDLAPGLKFDENGMPVMSNMGEGMPGMPGGEGLPDLAGLMANGQGQCCLS